MFAIWPESSTLSEAGAAPNLGAGGGGGNPFGGAGMSTAPNAGEIALSRSETAALAALESEEDEEHGLRRAQAESGLSRQQLRMLQRRATHLSSKGYTLKGLNFTKRPLASNPDEPGLTRKGMKGEDDDAKSKSMSPAKKPAAKMKEANATVVRSVTDPLYYTLPPELDYGLPSPASADEPEPGEKASESNTMSTLANMLSRNRAKKRRTSADC